MKWLKSFLAHIDRYLHEWWLRPLLAFIALIDHFVLVFPVDAILLTTTFLQPRKWLRTALWFWLGSCLGIIIFFYLVRDLGLPFVTWISPDITTSSIWVWTAEFFKEYGLWVLFISAFSSIPQQPAAAILALADVPFEQFAAVYLAGRALKYGGLCYLAAFAPGLLKKLWHPPKPPIQE